MGNKGIFRSADLGATWQAVNQAGFGSLDQMPFVALAANPSAINKGVFASTGYGGMVVASTDAASHWMRLDPCLVSAYVGRTVVAGNKLFALTSSGIFMTDISSLYAPARPGISGFSPATLPPSGSAQLVTITGVNFLSAGDPNASTLVFTDPVGNTYARTPINVTATSMQYNLTVQSATGTWKVKVVNGSIESLPFSFTVASGTAQLSGLSISGPGAVNENGSGQFSATAYFTDGSQQTVTSSVSWSENSTATTISSSGLLGAGSVNSDTGLTVSASYTYGGITKTASANVTVVNYVGCGTTQSNPVFDGGFESLPLGTGWTMSGAIASANGGFARTGTYFLWLGGAVSFSDSAYQTITVPSAATAATLSFYYNINSQEGISVANDTFTVTIRDSSGNLLATVASLSNKDQTSPGSAYYTLKTFDLLPYAGRTIRIHFASVNNATLVTNFRVDDVSVALTVANPVVPVLFGVGGPTNVAEGSTAQFSAIVVNCDGSVQSVTPTWSENSPYTSISASGLLTAGNVSSDTPVTVTATYGTTTLNYPITIVNVVPTFSSLSLSGPSSVLENGNGQFTAVAVMSDGSTQSVSPTWSVDSAAASISGAGLLSGREVASDSVVTVTATCTLGGVARSATRQVTVVNVPPAPTLTSLSISGPGSVNENSSAQYSAAAVYSDGSSSVVDPVWSQDLGSASISVLGLFAAGEVLSNTVGTISASYSTGGITRGATAQMTVMNVVPPRPVLKIAGAGGRVILSWPTNFVGFVVEYSTNLAGGGWQSNAVPASVLGTDNVVTNLAGGSGMFFRLRK